MATKGDDAELRNTVNELDAIAVDSLFCNYWSPADQDYRLWKLELFSAAGKTILSVEYIDTSLQVEYFDTLALQSFEILSARYVILGSNVLFVVRRPL